MNWHVSEENILKLSLHFSLKVVAAVANQLKRQYFKLLSEQKAYKFRVGVLIELNMTQCEWFRVVDCFNLTMIVPMSQVDELV